MLDVRLIDASVLMHLEREDTCVRRTASISRISCVYQRTSSVLMHMSICPYFDLCR